MVLRERTLKFGIICAFCVTSLLNVRHLLKQGLIITLQLTIFLLENRAFRLVMITTFFHLPRLDLASLDLIGQLLHLPLMHVVILELFNLFLQPFN